MSKIEIFENYRNGELETYTMSKEALGKLIDDVEASAKKYERERLFGEVFKIRSAAISTCEEGDAIDREDVLYLLSK